MLVLTRWHLRSIAIALVGAASIFLAFLLAGGPTVYAFCDLPNAGDNGAWFDGGIQTPPNTPTGIVSTLWNYNPDPVQRASSFWVMINRQQAGAGRWAQVGWVKWGPGEPPSTATENIFPQYHASDNAGSVTTRYLNCASNTWVQSPACEPSSAISYWVTFNTSTQQFTMWVNGYATYQTANVGWTPDHFEDFAEIHEGDLNNPESNRGRDHSPGHDTNRIHSENVMVSYVGSGGWISANLTRTPDPQVRTMGYQRIEDIPGWPSQNYFRIWDSRCPNG